MMGAIPDCLFLGCGPAPTYAGLLAPRLSEIANPEPRIPNPERYASPMHIPEPALSDRGRDRYDAGAGGIGVASALRAEKSDPQPMPAGLLGAAAAFVFAAQMINVPVAPATAATWSAPP